MLGDKLPDEMEEPGFSNRHHLGNSKRLRDLMCQDWPISRRKKD